MAQKISLRHVQVDKTNTLIIVLAAVAAACLAFSLVAVQSLWGQARYNAKVISAKEKTVNQLDANLASLDQLKKSYETFVNEPTNIIGGSSSGTGDRDGDNAKITLDALPSVYDFPGTISGFTKLLSNKSFVSKTPTGNDDEITQSTNATPEIVDVPLNFSATGSPEAIQEFITLLDNSIRPVKVNVISFGGDGGSALTVDVEGTTYYLPKKAFQVKTEVIQ